MINKISSSYVHSNLGSEGGVRKGGREEEEEEEEGHG